MQRNTKSKKDKGNPTISFNLTSWPRNRAKRNEIVLKKKLHIIDMLEHISTMPEFENLNGEFMIKVVYAKQDNEKLVSGKTYRVGGKYYPIDMSLSDLQSNCVERNQSIELKLITPDKYQNNGHNENPIYTVRFLLQFGHEPPKNLHGKCAINNKRLGYDYGDSEPNNTYENLILIKTPLGNYLVNTYCLLDCVTGAGRTDIKPNENFDAIIKLDDAEYKIPKRSKILDQLTRFVASYESSTDYVINMSQYETMAGKLRAMF